MISKELKKFTNLAFQIKNRLTEVFDSKNLGIKPNHNFKMNDLKHSNTVIYL